jgi:hypothetical protein
MTNIGQIFDLAAGLFAAASKTAVGHLLVETWCHLLGQTRLDSSPVRIQQ